MGKVVGFGDFLVRLSPPGYQRFLQASSFEACYTGAEANVLASLGLNRVPTEFVTRLPDNLIADAALTSLRRFGVGTGHVVFGGDRMGSFYLEKGASQRPSRLVYDRKFTSLATAVPEDFDWDAILDGATHFHFTGITPALGPHLPAICLEACRKAKRRGLTVSCDLNYRSLLWELERAQKTMRELIPCVDILVGNLWDAVSLLGAAPGDGGAGAQEHAAAELASQYGLRLVALTSRTCRSASDNDWSAMLWQNGTAYRSRQYRIHLVDRVGGGDSFTAGLLYAVLQGYDPQHTVEFAAAAGCLKQTIEQDFNLSYAGEIERLASGDDSGRILR